MIRFRVSEHDCHEKGGLDSTGITLIDGDRKVIGSIIYNHEKTVAHLLQKCEKSMHLYNHWPLQSINPIVRPKEYLCTTESPEEAVLIEKCNIEQCLCNQPFYKTISYKWIEMRQELPLGEHWLQQISDHVYERETPMVKNVPICNMVDPGMQWKRSLGNDSFRTNPLFRNKMLYKEEDYKKEEAFHGSSSEKETCGAITGPVPDLVYKVLIRYLDAVSWINLATSSPIIETRLMDVTPIPSTMRELHFYNFCIQDLNRCKLIHMWASFDFEEPAEKDQYAMAKHLSWETVFRSYKNYWLLLSEGTVKSQNLNQLEQRLKGQMLVVNQLLPVNNKKLFWSIGSLGGRMIYNVWLPHVQTYAENSVNLFVIKDCEKVDIIDATSVCKTLGSPKHFVSKIVYFPLDLTTTACTTCPKPNKVYKVLIAASEFCVSIVTFETGISRKISIASEEVKSFCSMEPIMEIQDNVVAVWLRPTFLMIFLVIPAYDNLGRLAFDIYRLYRLQNPIMEMLWNTFVQFRSDYLPVVRDFKGDLPTYWEETRNNLLGSSSYMFSPTEINHYGLAMISPIYGIECLKPSGNPEQSTAIIESFPPEYYTKNGQQFASCIRERWNCSAKGHGLFVFCNDKAVAVSWNCITWIFGSLYFPLAEKDPTLLRNLVHVEVVSDYGILLVAKDIILLVELTLVNQPPNLKLCINLAEPTLEVRVVRYFPLGLAQLNMEPTHFELNYDNGRPFFLIIAYKKPKECGDNCSAKSCDDFSFRIKRIDFSLE